MSNNVTWRPSGRHLIAGAWRSTPEKFHNEPISGFQTFEFSAGNLEVVDEAVQAATAASPLFSALSREKRAAFLRSIADNIDARADEITWIGTQETGLPAARLEGERGRTVGQLRLFAEHIERGDYLDRRHDSPLPDRLPVPRPDLRLMQIPVGPVAVFGASNFPLAFSVAGGDTASALAAGCPVIVKGHSGHPGTSEIVAEAIHAAITEHKLPAGTFSLIQGGNRHVGHALVTHDAVCAVGFTGSLAGGRALFDLCASRAEPIPFFGELGSVNPMFIFPEALRERANLLGTEWARSLTMGAGQFCTNPGIAVLLADTQSDAFISAAVSALKDTPTQAMLTPGIAAAYAAGVAHIAETSGVTPHLRQNAPVRSALPNLFSVSATEWLGRPELAEEVFGPVGLVVLAETLDEMKAVAQSLHGQLTCTLHVADKDYPSAQTFVPILSAKAGRVLVNGFPTGVEVSDAMVHSGPYPASTNFGATSVGTMAIRRWLRPVAFQGFPVELLPKDLQDI